MARQKWSWTDKQIEKADWVIDVCDELRPYWPLTLRQIYYRLVAGQFIENTKSQYNMLSTLIKWMRIDGRLSWRVIEDRTRTISDKRGWEDVEDFVSDQLDDFLEYYARCLVQTQGDYLEVWIEKEALYRIVEEKVWPYCLRTVCNKGYASVTFLANFYKRAIEAFKRGLGVRILYFGDLDPSGVQMFEASQETLLLELELYNHYNEGKLIFERIALNPSHIDEFDLPHDPTAVKMTDPRYKKYVDEYGEIAVELDALHPADLERLVGEAIEERMDMEAFQEQKEIEEQDDEVLNQLREEVIKVINAKLENI